MTAKEFWQYFKQNENQSKSKLGSLFLVALIMFAVFIVALIFINGQGSRLSIAENEINREKSFIAQYAIEEARFKKEHENFVRLTPRNEVEKIQNGLIQKMKEYNLNVISVQSMQSTDITAMEFEMSFSGEWETVIKYIRQLPENAGLISIINCTMNPKAENAVAGNLVETKLKYKIYVE